VPRAAGVCCVVKLARVGDEVGTIGRESVMIECQERLLWKEAIPCVTFVAGLPDRRVLKTDKDGRRLFEVRVLYNRCCEFELSSKLYVSTCCGRDGGGICSQFDE